MDSRPCEHEPCGAYGALKPRRASAALTPSIALSCSAVRNRQNGERRQERSLITRYDPAVNRPRTLGAAAAALSPRRPYRHSTTPFTVELQLPLRASPVLISRSRPSSRTTGFSSRPRSHEVRAGSAVETTPEQPIPARAGAGLLYRLVAARSGSAGRAAAMSRRAEFAAGPRPPICVQDTKLIS